MSNFVKRESPEYLNLAIGGVLRNERWNGLDFEIDPNKIGDENARAINLENLNKLLDSIFDSIMSSVKLVPPTIKHLSQNLLHLVHQKYPGSGKLAIGGFLVLRLISPAILNPSTYGITGISTHSKSFSRGLVVASKVIQNMANGVLFGNKESHMTYFNNFLESNRTRFEIFLESILNNDGEIIHSSAKDEGTVLIGAMKLHKILSKYSTRLEDIPKSSTFRVSEYLAPETLQKTTEENAQEDELYGTFMIKWTDCLENIPDILESLGIPPDINSIAKRLEETKKFRRDSINYGLPELPVSQKISKQRRQGNQVLYATPKNANHNTILYYIARKIRTDTMDPIAIRFSIMNSVRPYLDEPITVLVDLTYFSALNEWPAEMVESFDQLLSVDSQIGLKNLIFVNPNSYFKKIAKKYSKIFTLKQGPKIDFVSSEEELSALIPENLIDLPQDTMKLLKSKASGYGNVFLVSSRKRELLPVIIFISSDYIRISYTKKTDIMGFPTFLSDSFRTSSIIDFGTINEGEEKRSNEFFIKSSDIYLHLISEQKEILIQQLNQVVSLARLGQIKGEGQLRMVRPQDLPGTLINIAFFNICSENRDLRTAGAELLVSITSSRNNPRESELPDLKYAKWLRIPLNVEDFIVRISQELSITEKSLTFEYLTECLNEYPKYPPRQKYFALLYIEPWIGNLESFLQEDEDKTKQLCYQIISGLIYETKDDTTMLVQSRIWKTIGQQISLAQVFVQAIIDRACVVSPYAKEKDVLLSVLVTMARSEIVVSKIFDLAHRYLSEATLQSEISSLTEASNWRKICVISRIFLELSFDDGLKLESHLPDVLFFSLFTVGVGSPFRRSIIHETLVNVLIQLLNQDPNSSTLVKALGSLQNPYFPLLFGQENSFNSKTVGISISREFHEDAKYQDECINAVEYHCAMIWEILCTGVSQPNISQKWQNQFYDMIFNGAFSPKYLCADRNFVGLAYVSPELSSELFRHILQALIDCFQQDLLVKRQKINGITRSLKILLNQGKLQNYDLLPALFWTSLVIIQFGLEDVFAGAVNLFYEVIEIMAKEGCPWTSPEQFLKYYTKIEEEASELNEFLGIIPKESFGLYLSASLLKGFSRPTTTKVTRNAMLALLKSSVKHHEADSNAILRTNTLAYMTSLIPGDTIQNVFLYAGFGDAIRKKATRSIEKNTGELLDKYLDYFGSQPKLLALVEICMYRVLLANSKSEQEVLLICRIISRIAERFPQLLSPLYDNFKSRFTNIHPLLNEKSMLYKNTPTSAYVDLTSKLMALDAAKPTLQAPKITEILEATGFQGIFEQGSFHHTEAKELLRPKSELVSNVLKCIAKSF
jgi:neurofibromin 1